MDEDGTQLDRFHEDHVLEGGAKRVRVLHGAAAELDHRQLIAEGANIAEGFDEHIGFANRLIHRY